MESTSGIEEQSKTFSGTSASAAREAASRWLRDFGSHGPLDIRSIRVSEEKNSFVAEVVFSDAKIEQAPRHFANYQPAPELA